MLTIVIPTKNRPDFLARLLRYCAHTRCPYPILIGDSSDPEPLDQTRGTLHDLQGVLQVTHRLYPTFEGYPSDIGLTETLSDLLQQVETPYVVFVADDDAVIPDAMREAVHFLEGHSDYSAVHGKAALCSLSGGVHGDVEWLAPYWLPEVTASTAVERLRIHLQIGGATEFSVKRTHQMRACWQARRTLGLNRRFGELLVSCMGVIQGKIHCLNRFYMVRQGHAQMGSRHPALEELIIDPCWSSQFVLFRDHLVGELVQKDGIPEEQAREVIQQGFFYHVVKIMVRKRSAHVAGWPGAKPFPLHPPFWNRWAQRVPAFRKPWQWVRSVLPGESHRMSLPALLRSGSPFHGDFVPIYQAFTGENHG